MNLGSIFYELDAETMGFTQGTSKAEWSLDDLETKTKSTDAEIGKLKAGTEKFNQFLMTGLAVGVGAIATGIGAVGVSSFNLSKDLQASQGQMRSELNLTEEASAELGEVVKDVWGNNFGESVEDVTDTIIQARKQIVGLADEDMQRVTEGALAIRDSFDAEVGQTLNATNALMQNFGLTSDQAMNAIASGFKAGLNNSDDFLDSITEYSNQFGEGGATADEFFNIMASGMGAGVLGTDKVADLFKEFMIRVRDGSTATRDAFEQLGYDYDGMMQDLQDGTLTGMDLFSLLQTEVAHTGDVVKQQETGVALFGTMFEDLGVTMFQGIDSATDKWTENEGALDSLNERYETFDAFVAGMWRNILLEVEPYTTMLLDHINTYQPQLQGAIENVSVALDGGIQFIQSSIDFYNQYKPIIDTFVIVLGSMATAYWLVTTAMSVWAGIQLWNIALQGTLNALFLASPVGWVILGIGALIAIGVLLWQNWDTVGAVWGNVWNGIKNTAGAVWGWLKSSFFFAMENQLYMLVNPITALKWAFDRNLFGIRDTAQNVWGSIQSIFKFGVNSVIDSVNRMISGYNRLNDVVGLPDIGLIPRLHSGGKTKQDGLNLVRDDEALIYLPNNTDVMSPTQTARAMNSGDNQSGGTKIEFVFNQLIPDNESFRDAIKAKKRILREELGIET